jgi:hypothetical protein
LHAPAIAIWLSKISNGDRAAASKIISWWSLRTARSSRIRSLRAH